jgi:hexosaminidase
MKWSGKSILFLAVISCFFSCGDDNTTSIQTVEYLQESSIQLIPQAREVKIGNGYFTIDEKTTITSFNDSEKEANYLKHIIEESSKFEIKVNLVESIDLSQTNNTILIFNQHQTSGKEAYNLSITKNSLNIMAMSNEGIMRGIQTLRQLFVDEFHTQEKRDSWYLPTVSINDSPKFKHRGLLLDCARHFYDKDVVKKYIDLLALYKMNVLHWHLTEDQGWRIEIDKYPKLTEIGAWRTELDGSKYGGFYTKEDIREILTYATERHITVIPEIELPGHSQAAIAAYPHLSCTGNQVDVANDWGVFKEIYCAGNDSVFNFLEDVLTEVMELFPSTYIHIGGDEAPKYRWKNCNDCQGRLKHNLLTDEHELQRYFISRIEKFLNKNGRQIIGWDEILEGGLSPNATVQSWRGMDGGIKAAESGHNAIMSPTSHCYLDYNLKAIDLEKVYKFDPIPTELAKDKQHFIIGGEVNMWTEHVPDESNLDSKVFPRLMAMSEVLWSYPEERNYEEFYGRVQHHYPILKNLGVKYGQETIPMTFCIDPAMEGSYVTLIPSSEKINLKYRKDCTGCDSNYIDYNGTKIHITQPQVIQVQPYKNEGEYGALIEIPFEYHRAINQEVNYTNEFSEWYTAGGNKGLVDSRIGTLDFRDGAWQGFWGKDLECIIDMDGVNKDFQSVSANFYQYNNSWIFIPTEMSAQISDDGKVWEDWGSIKSESDPKQRGKFISNLKIKHKDGNSFRYIKLTVKNFGKVPDWHEAAGSDAWLFIDEIVVK